MSEAERPPSRESAAHADRARRDARLRSLEDVYMRRGIIFVVIATVVFSFAVWGVAKLVSERKPSPPRAREVSHALRGVYNAAYADGIRMFESDRRADLARWLHDKVGPHATLPDLSAAHLVPSGVRVLNIGKGWGMIQYRDRAGPSGDVLAVMAPINAVRVGDDAVAEAVGDAKVWVLADHGLTFAWLEGARADWVLVSARDQAGLLAAARAMVNTVG